MQTRRASLVLVLFCVLACSAVLTHAQDTEAEALDVSLARMYPVSSAEALRVLDTVLHDAGLAVSRLDAENGVMRTSNVRFKAKRFPGLEIVPPKAYWGAGKFKTKAIRVYAYVSQHVEPARVHITSRIEFERFKPPQLIVRDHLPELGDWVFAKFEERIGAKGVAIPTDVESRWRLAQQLANEGGIEDPCLARKPWADSADEITTEAVYLKKSHPKLTYSATAERREQSGDFETTLHMMEDGALQKLELEGDLENSGDLPVVTHQHARFIRCAPAKVDGCAVIFIAPFDYHFYFLQKDRRQPLK